MKQGLVSKMLQFDKDRLINEFLNNLEIELNDASKAWENEALSKMRGIKFAHDYENLKAKVNKEVIRQSKGIIVYLKANGVALADSYGVGSLMTSDNPGLQEYMNSDRWNKARSGKAIVGRPEEYYTDMFGRPRHSTGSAKGLPLEGKKVYTRKNEGENDYYISPSYPSYAIQMANNWLKKTYLPRAYKLAVEKTNFGKFLIES